MCPAAQSQLSLARRAPALWRLAICTRARRACPPQLEFFAEEEPITIIPSFQLRTSPNGMLSCIGVRAPRHWKRGVALEARMRSHPSSAFACIGLPDRGSMQQEASRSAHRCVPPANLSTTGPHVAPAPAGRVRPIPPQHAGRGAHLAGAAAAQARQVPHHTAGLPRHRPPAGCVAAAGGGHVGGGRAGGAGAGQAGACHRCLQHWGDGRLGSRPGVLSCGVAPTAQHLQPQLSTHALPPPRRAPAGPAPTCAASELIAAEQSEVEAFQPVPFYFMETCCLLFESAKDAFGDNFFKARLARTRGRSEFSVHAALAGSARELAGDSLRPQRRHLTFLGCSRPAGPPSPPYQPPRPPGARPAAAADQHPAPQDRGRPQARGAGVHHPAGQPVGVRGQPDPPQPAGQPKHVPEVLKGAGSGCVRSAAALQSCARGRGRRGAEAPASCTSVVGSD